MGKLILTGFVLSLLWGCATKPKELFSEINVESKFYDRNISPNTYLLALNSFHEYDPELDSITFGPSYKCASSIIDNLNKLGFTRVYHQINAKYIISLHCETLVTSSDNGYKASVNHGIDVKTSSSTITSSNSIGSLQVRSSEVASRINSIDITKSVTSIMITQASVSFYENIEPFQPRDRKLMWHGMANTDSLGSLSNMRSASEEELIDALFETFSLKENVGDFYGFEEKTIKAPWYEQKKGAGLDLTDWSMPFLYTLLEDDSNRVAISPFGKYVYKPWMTVYQKGERVSFSAKNNYELSGIIAQTTLTSEKMSVSLKAQCIDSTLYLFLFIGDEGIDFSENDYDVFIYDSYEGLKLSLPYHGTNKILIFDDEKRELFSLMSVSQGTDADYISVVIPELEIDIPFRKEGFKESFEIAYPECFL